MRTRFFSFCFSLSVFLPLDLHAITNIESQRTAKDVTGLQGNVEYAITGKSGNSDKQSTAIAARVDYRQGQHQGLGIIRSEYGESNDIKDVDNNFAHTRYILHRSELFAWETFAQYQDDAFRLLDRRVLLGAGSRFSFSGKQDNYQITLGLGAYYTEERFQLATSTLEEDYARANCYISASKKIGDHASLSNTLYWQPRFSQLSDSYVYNNFSLEVKINTALAIKLSLETQYDSEPVADLEHADHSYYSSIVYHF